jgi:hypothetical protein
MASEPEVVPLSDLSSAELNEAFRASRAASRALVGVSLAGIGRMASEMGDNVGEIQGKSVDTTLTAEVTHGVVGEDEIRAARELTERMGGRVSRERLAEEQAKLKAEEARRRQAHIEVQKTPRNHAERREARKNPYWTRDGLSLAYLGVTPKPKGTKSSKRPKRKQKRK